MNATSMMKDDSPTLKKVGVESVISTPLAMVIFDLVDEATH